MGLLLPVTCFAKEGCSYIIIISRYEKSLLVIIYFGWHLPKSTGNDVQPVADNILIMHIKGKCEFDEKRNITVEYITV